jgi:hypothetical protein
MRAKVRSPPPSAMAKDEAARDTTTNKVLIDFMLVSSVLNYLRDLTVRYLEVSLRLRENLNKSFLSVG